MAGLLLDSMFPEPEAAFIPTFVIAGDRATSAAARDAARRLRSGGVRIGLALKDGAVLDGMRMELRENRVPRAAALLLRDPSLDVLVAATSLRRVVGHGLGLEVCHGAAILQEEGADPAETHAGSRDPGEGQSRAFVVAAGNRAAREALAGLGRERLILVYEDDENPGLAEHLERGGGAVVRRWSTSGPVMCLVASGGTVAEAPLESRAHARARNIEASMFAFGLAEAAGQRRSGTEARRHAGATG